MHLELCGQQSTVRMPSNLYYIDLTDCFKAKKGIVPVNLIRMKIATTQSGGVLGATRFEHGWDLQHDFVVRNLYNAIIRTMDKEPYGMWDTAILIFGKSVANMLVAGGEIVGRNVPEDVECGPASPRKRRIERIERGDDSEDEDEPPSKRRQ